MSIIKRCFTLAEMIVVTVIIGVVFIVVINLYSKMLSVRIDAEAKQGLIYGSYNIVEKLNVLIKDYSIDYEEYFNRMVIGCDGNGGNNFTWSGANGVGLNGYCDKFTYYGNNSWATNNWKLYYCSETSTENGVPNYVKLEASLSTNGSGCWNNATYGNNNPQSFGQYKNQFIDLKNDTNNTGGVLGDDDDLDLGVGPNAIGENLNAQELYLISKDNKNRIFIKRSYIGSGNWDNKGATGDSDIDNLYSLQMLKLKGFDAGSDHTFSNGLDGDYDGQIDTWVCDKSNGFICNGSSLSNDIFSGFNFANSVNDGYINIFGNDITIKYWNLQILPDKNPYYNYQEDNKQINPFIKLHITTKLYGESWSWKINPDNLNGYELDIQTTFNIRNNY